tara:strand:+ start:257 stop:463 length:207 start_codon:yes stop_codon:yes gene_type:complete
LEKKSWRVEWIACAHTSLRWCFVKHGDLGCRVHLALSSLKRKTKTEKDREKDKQKDKQKDREKDREKE